tara:strand:+ start:1192 stop:5391 length:4200 start_codon:yes stop_codon:yes gene_type:complete
MSELSTFDKIIAGKVTGSSQESSTSPSTFDKIIGGEITDSSQKPATSPSVFDKIIGGEVTDSSTQPVTSKVEQEIDKEEDDRSVNDLIKDPKWISSGVKIYEYEEGKPFNVAESGYDSPGDWLADRHSSLAWNLTDLGFTAAKTALNIDEMPDDVKQAWVNSLQDFDAADTDLKSTLRAFKNTGADPATWGSIIAGFGVGGLAKLIGGRAATAAAKFELKKQLIAELAKRGVTEGSGKATEEIVKEARKEALKTVGKQYAKTGAASGATFAGAQDISRQSLETDIGVIDPETGEVKQPDRLQTALTVGGGAFLGGALGRYGPVAAGQIGKSKAIKEMTDTINKSPNSNIDLLEVTEAIPGKPQARHAITERLAKINTGAGRLFSSASALPPELFRAAIKKSRGDRAINFELKKSLRDLNKAVKNNLSDLSEKEKDDLINGYFAGNTASIQAVDNIPALKTQLERVKDKVNQNESALNNYLGLPDNQKLGVQRGDNEIYITRTFISENNPLYLKDISKALNNEKVDAKFINKVENAREYFKGLYKNKYNEDEINGIILNVVERLAKPQEGGGILLNPLQILNNVVENSTMSPQAKKILAKKKDLDEPILELLGERTDWTGNIRNTLGKQRRLLNEIEYLSSVDMFFKQALNKQNGGEGVYVELGGLIPKKLPRVRARVVESLSPTGTSDASAGLYTLVENTLGKDYANRKGNQISLLKDIYTSPKMLKFIEGGIDYFGPTSEKLGTGRFGRFIQNAAAFGQASQTILDIPAYIVNLYGAGQSFLSNGHLFNFAKGQAWKKSGQQLRNQYFGTDEAATKSLLKLKEQGVIDTDLSAEMIQSAVNNFGRDAMAEFKDRPVRATLQRGLKGYQKGLGFLSEAYGATDTASKIMAHSFELQDLRKIYKNEIRDGRISEDDLFAKASEIVRDTMPSYSVASPAARQLSKLPVGTYALFPSEIIRTHKNIIKNGINDIKQLNNPELSAEAQRGLAIRGLKRLTGLATVTSGIGYYTTQNNEEYGITNQHKRVLNMLAPDGWGKGQNQFFLEGMIQEGNGPIMTRFSNSSQFDAADILKLPIRQITGRLIAGDDIKDFEVDEAIAAVSDSITGPYTSPKFFWDGLGRALLTQKTKSGKPLYSELKGEEKFSTENIRTGMVEFAKTLEPGTSQVITRGNKFAESAGYKNLIDYIQNGWSDEDLNRLGKSASGFPQNLEDIESWMTTGIRTSTVNLNRSIGFNLSEPLKQAAATQIALDAYLGKLDPNPNGISDEVGEELLERYKELQESKYQAMNEVAEKVGVTLGMPYKKRIKDDLIDKNINFGDIIKMSTDNFYYSPKEQVIQAGAKSSIKNLARTGIVIPDKLFANKQTDRKLREKFGKDFRNNKYIKEILRLSNQPRKITVKGN